MNQNNKQKKYAHIIVDGSNLFFRLVSLYEKGMSEKKFLQDMLHNLYHILENLKTKYAYQDTTYYFLFDNPESRIRTRKEIDPDYKSNREFSRFDFDAPLILNWFVDTLKFYSDQFRIVRKSGYEADDLTKPLLARIRNSSNGDFRIVVSSDLDWARNMDDLTDWYNWSQLYTSEEFFKKYKFFPSETSICIYKAIHGDASDNIPISVPHFPFELTLDLIDSCNKPEACLAYVPENPTYKKWMERLYQSRNRFLKNIQLTRFMVCNLQLDDVYTCRLNILRCRALFKALDVALPTHLREESEFFN